MARWKARVEFLLSVIGLLFFYLLRLRRYKAKGVKTRCYLEGVGQFERRFQGEGVIPGEYFLVSTKLDTFSYRRRILHRANAVVLTQYRRVTDGRTDGQTELV